ncbi:hypothetical protein BW42_03078 [Exiguobacterium sp. RIT341]|nr:hypothetical protein BW42_03078 [Exiguobacterium sp. RIT341]
MSLKRVKDLLRFNAFMFILPLIFFILQNPVHAEVGLTPFTSIDSEIEGTAEADTEVMILFANKWYATKSDADGKFKMRFDQKIGRESIGIREKQMDGTYGRIARYSAEQMTEPIQPPKYLGKNKDGESLFYSPQGYETVVLAGERVYSGTSILRIKNLFYDSVKAYVRNGEIKSEIVSIDIATPEKIPFTISSKVEGDQVIMTGKTLPSMKFFLKNKMDDGTWEEGTLFRSDEEGYFSEALYELTYFDEGIATYRIDMSNIGEDVMPEIFKSPQNVNGPMISADNPLIIKTERIRENDYIRGEGRPGYRVFMKRDDMLQRLGEVNALGNFSIFVPRKIDAPAITLVVQKEDGTYFGQETHRLYEKNFDSHDLVLDDVTSDSTKVTGSAPRFMDIHIDFIGVMGSYRINTTSDENGRFSALLPNEFDGTVTVTASYGGSVSMTRKTEVIDLRPNEKPSYYFENDTMKVSVSNEKLIDKWIELSKIHDDGTFDVRKFLLYDRNPSGGYEIGIEDWLDGDRFTLRVVDENNVKSDSVIGEYVELDSPRIDDLDDGSKSIVGRTAPNLKVSAIYYDGHLETTYSDAIGNFTVKLPDVSPAHRPYKIVIDDEKNKVRRTVGLTYRDTTPPAIKVEPIQDRDDQIRASLMPGDTMRITIVYDDGGTETVDAMRRYWDNVVYSHHSSFGRVAYFEFVSTDPNGNESRKKIIPIDTVRPSLDMLVTPYAGEDSIEGKTEPQANVTVSISGREYTAKADGTGRFSIKTHVLKASEKVDMEILDKGDNLVTLKDASSVLGINSVELMKDRKSVVLKTNIKGSRVDPYLTLEYEGKKITQGFAEKVVFNLDKPLKNHSEIKIHLSRRNAPQKVVYKAKQSDTIGPSTNVGIDWRDDWTVGTRLYGTSEPGATVEIYQKSKRIFYVRTASDGKFEYVVNRAFGTREQLLLRVTDIVGNRSEKKVVLKHVPRKPTVNPVFDNSKTITGKTEPGLTVEIKINTTKYLVKADSRGNYRLSGKGWPVGSRIVVKAKGKDGIDSPYERRTVKGTIKYLEVKNVTSSSRFVEGKTERDSYVQVFKNGKSISKKVLVAKDGKFKLSIPRQTAKTKLVVKVERNNFKSLEKTLIVGK